MAIIPLILLLFAFPVSAAVPAYKLTPVPPTASLNVPGVGVYRGVVSGSANAGSYAFSVGPTVFPGQTASMRQAIASAVTYRLPVEQSLARRVAVTAMRSLPGVALTGLALELGYEYASGAWRTPEPQPPTQIAFQIPGDSHWYTPSQASGTLCPAGGLNTCVATAVGLPASACNYAGSPQYACQHGFVNPYPPTYRPVSEADWAQAPDAIGRNLTDSELQQMVSAGYGVPVGQPVPEPIPGQSRQPVGQPFTDPLTGQRYQPYVSVEPYGDQDGSVRVTPYDAPIDANGNPQLGPDNEPVPPREPTESKTELGSLDPEDDPKPAHVEIELAGGYVTEGGICPGARSFTASGQSYAIEYQPLCDAAQDYVRPLLLASASLGALMIVYGGVRGI